MSKAPAQLKVRGCYQPDVDGIVRQRVKDILIMHGGKVTLWRKL